VVVNDGADLGIRRVVDDEGSLYTHLLVDLLILGRRRLPEGGVLEEGAGKSKSRRVEVGIGRVLSEEDELQLADDPRQMPPAPLRKLTYSTIWRAASRTSSSVRFSAF